MKVILDFAVWTLGVSLALPVYLQRTFLPRGDDWVYYAVLMATGLSLLSACVGVWFRSAASKVLAVDDKAKPAGNERILAIGAAHSWLLGLAVAITAVLFVQQKVLPTQVAGETCGVEATLAGVPATIAFPCGSSLEEIYGTGEVTFTSPVAGDAASGGN